MGTVKIAANVPSLLTNRSSGPNTSAAHGGVQAVGADDEVEAAVARVFERHIDAGAAVFQGDDGVVKQVFGAVLGCLVKQFDQVVAQQLDVGVVDGAAGGCRFGVAGQLVAVAVYHGGAANVCLAVRGGLQQPRAVQHFQRGTPHVDGLATRPQAGVALRNRDRKTVLREPIRQSCPGHASAGNQNFRHRIPACFLASLKMSSSIVGVNLPVNIFCWLGW